MNPIFKFLSSLRLTIVLLAFSIVLVFFGTLDQVEHGIKHTQSLYFESWVVLSPVVTLLKMLASQNYDPSLEAFVLPIPGGFTLGLLLLINLTCSHFRYFKASWKKSGIAILHFGVLLLLISGFLTAMLQEESIMSLDEGGAAVPYSTDFDAAELTLIDTSNPDHDTVTAVPFHLLNENVGREIPLPNGFKIQVYAAMPNSGMGMRSTLVADYERALAQNVASNEKPLSPGQRRQVEQTLNSLRDPNVVAIGLDGLPLFRTEGLSMQGFAPRMDGVAIEHELVSQEDEANITGAAIGVVAPNGENLGVWLLSSGLGPQFPTQGFDFEGTRYDLGLRFERTYFPFTMQLEDFRFDRYPGTNKPRNFSSDVIIDNPETGENRKALIYMNHPLRYGGYTFFQSSFANNETTTILQVVRNPGWLLPYIAVGLVGLGMLVQFSLSLFKRFKGANPKRALSIVGGFIGLLLVAKVILRSGMNSTEFLYAVMIGSLIGLAVYIAKTNRKGDFTALSAVALLLGALIIGSQYNQRHQSDFPVQSFAELPVQSGGRMLPIDSVARNSLRIISGKQKIRVDGEKLTAIEWMLDLNFKPETADGYPVFRIDHPEVLGLFGWEQKDQKYFSWNELSPHFNALQEANQAIPEEEVLRSGFQKAVVKLVGALTLYNTLSHALYPGPDFTVWPEIAVPGSQAFGARERGEPFEQSALQPFVIMTDFFLRLSQTADLGIAYPASRDNDDWLNIGEAMLQTIQSGQLNPVAAGYGELGNAYREGDPEAFNQALLPLRENLSRQVDAGKIAFEELFNRVQPFYTTMVVYVLILFMVLISWLKWTKPLQNAAFWLVILAFAAHTFGLLARMYIQERPPVTNLYSSAIFTGWVAIFLGIVTERIYRNGVGSFVAAVVGFGTLVVAHNLPFTGDTLEMMQAVLDSNFWLATHVVIITAGYGAVFVAGALGLLYVFRGLFTPSLDRQTAKALYGMCYGITCFGLLFSFVGTMLGGIWADQSWGRFWGWDPKENGALIIVLWGALMLHSRWGGIVRERGFMLLAIGGNIVTAWSWFGTNLLGIGLHSYGFMSAMFLWLTLFWLSQLAVIAIGSIPLKHWASFGKWKQELKPE